MMWALIFYFAGAAIAYVLVVRFSFREAVRAKRTLDDVVAQGNDGHYYRSQYHGELRFLVFFSPLAAAAWPFVLGVLALKTATNKVTGLLNRAVEAAAKEGET